MKRLVLPFALVACAAAGPARADELLRGPHPFLKENSLELAGGAGVADAYGGTHAAVTYDYQLDGSWWFELRLGLWRTRSGPFAKDPTCAAPPCARLDAMTDVLAGAQYRLRTNLPIVPYARAAVGPAFLFPTDAGRAAGLAMRVGAGAKWYVYDWLGFGAELGVMGATTGLDEKDAYARGNGLDARFLSLELLVAMEVQF